MKLVILRRKLRKVRQHPQEEQQQQQTSFKDLLENSRSKKIFALPQICSRIFFVKFGTFVYSRLHRNNKAFFRTLSGARGQNKLAFQVRSD